MIPFTRYIKSIFAFTLFAGLATACTDEIDAPVADGDVFSGLSFRCDGMTQVYRGDHNPASRAADSKTPEEKAIKSLHIFFFDSNGNLLEPENYDNFSSYQYVENATFIPIPTTNDGSVTLFNGDETNVHIVAIANIDAIDEGVNRFTTCFEKNPSGNICEHGRTESEDNPTLIVSKLDDLKKWVYYPRIRMSEDGIHGDITSLPETGMPMIGELENVNLKNKPADSYIVPMKALMAKVNISVELDPDQFTSQYPLLTITEYGVRNMPVAVPFVQPSTALKSGQSAPKPFSNPGVYEYKNYVDTYNVTNVPMYHRVGDGVTAAPVDPSYFVCDDAAHEFTTPVNVTINKDSKAVTFSYYTYENINLPDYGATRANGTPAFDDNLNPIYPTGQNGETIIKDEDKQRWKSTFAYADRASALILKGRYTTHQGISYNAEFSIYMGADPDIDFQVKRNHQYDNNIVIHGLDYIRNSSDNVYNFDGRVNVYDTENPLYLAIVNERKVDAHATALPMDVWLMLRENGTYQEETPAVDHYTDVTFTIPESARSWVQMVLIPRAEMEKANEITGLKFEAGRGAEKYFYTNLLTDIRDHSEIVLKGSDKNSIYGEAYAGHADGAQCGYTVTVHSTPGENGGALNNSRSRIYFYIDENVDGGDRSTSIQVNYKSYKLDENGQETNVRTLSRTVDIEQRGLLRVEGTWSNGSSTDNIPETYMEYYEEYLEHNDPLDRHEQPGELYSGLQWGFYGQYLRTFFGGDNYENPESGHWNSQVCYKTGAYEMTQFMVDRVDTDGLQDNYLFNEKAPQSVFHYCYGRNKRNYDGSAAVSGTVGWYTPGIRELEKALVDYYGTFPDFRGNWYWSASAAREGYIPIVNIPVSGQYKSRATQVILNGSTPTFAESETRGTPGYKDRTDICRVRTFYRKN